MNKLRILLTWFTLFAAAGSVSARPYDTWKQTHFGGNAGNPAIAGDAADPDDDGWVNAIEYAFGTRPTTASAPQWESDGGSAALKLHFQRVQNTDLDLFLEKSDILQPASWQVVAQSIAGTPFTSVDPEFGASESAGNPGEFAVLVKQSNPQQRCLFRVRAVPAFVQSIDVQPGTVQRYPGQSQQFTVVAMYSDGVQEDVTELSVWASSAPATATVSNAAGSRGLASCVAAGSAGLSAAYASFTGSATLDVLPIVLTSLTVTPAVPTIPVGAIEQFTATGTFSDASTQDLTAVATWSSSNPAAANISNGAGTWGLATGVAAGTTTISAAVSSVTGSTGFTVFQLPAVVSVSPTDSATGTSPFTTITITFSQAMNPATLTAQTSAGPAAGNIQVSSDEFFTCIGFTGPPLMSAGDTVATFIPSPALSQGTTWKVRVTTGAESATGYALAAPFLHANGFTTAVERCGTGLVISQIYGGGGNVGSVWKSDYIELYNPTNQSISTAGNAVQYASVAGGSWSVTPLTTASIPPGGYYLVQEATGAGGTTSLPTPNATGSITMSATGGKVALTSNTTALTGTAPASAAILDFIGWGAAGFFETSAAPATVTNATLITAVLRRNFGSADSNNNGNDCFAGTPNPRNSISPTTLSPCPNNETGLALEADFVIVQFPPALTVQVATPSSQIFARIYEAGLTEAAGASSLTCQIGYGPENSNPQNQAGWTWVSAGYNAQVGNDDEYAATLTVPAAGTYRYAARFSIDGTNWTYADANGAGSNAALTFETWQLPVLTVTP